MPTLERGETTIYYEDRGQGFPLLVIAPGGMHSTVDMWSRAAIDPLQVYDGEFRLIAMDQRNAGQSRGPFDVVDPWGSYAGDQLALLDHLGVEEFAVMGCCIGGSYIFKLIESAPERVVAAVLEQPIGIEDHNRHLFDAMWRTWAAGLVEARPDLDPPHIERFGAAMWTGDFVVSVAKDFVRSCRTPMLVLPGIDDHHPTAIGREIASLAPHAEVIEPWRDTPEHTAQAAKAVCEWLKAHTHH